MSRQRQPGSAGFTLIEVLIALAILGLVIAVLASGMRFAGRAWQTQENQVDREDDLIAVQGTLRAMIASGTTFQGGPDTLAFVGAMPHALQRSGLYDIDLTLSGDRLVLEWRPHLLPGGTPKPMSETALARGIAGLGFSYFLADDTGQGAWSANAKDLKNPPRLVRIDVALPADDRRRWPPFVIAPMIGGGPSS